MSDNQFKCEICRLDLENINNYNSHINGNRHKKQVEKAKCMNPLSIEEKTKCSIFVTGFSQKSKADNIIKTFSTFGKVVHHYFNTEKTFVIIQFENEKIAKQILSSKINVDGINLVMRPKILKEVKNDLTPAPNEDDDGEQIHNNIRKVLKRKMKFSDQVEDLINELQLPIYAMTRKYSQVCSDLEIHLGRRFPRCRAYPFGSTITGLGFKQSDLDVYIEINPRDIDHLNPTFASELTKKSRNILSKTRVFSKVLAIPKAKTPIVKCIHVPTGVSCDFNFKSMLGVCNSRLIKFLISSNKVLLGTMIIIKYWAKKFKQSTNGKFSNYALTMLYIFYLQQRNYLPSIDSLQKPDCTFIQEGWNGGFCADTNLLPDVYVEYSIPDVLLGFFEFYWKFDYGLWVISPLVGKPIFKSNFMDVNLLPTELHFYKQKVEENSQDNTFKINFPMCVQDPFVLAHNITSIIQLKSLKEFQILCENSALTIISTRDNPNNLLEKLLFTVTKPDNNFAEIFTDKLCMFRIQFSSEMLYNKDYLYHDNKVELLSKIWFEKLHEFLVKVLTKVFLFKITVKKQGPFKKCMKTEGKSNVHDNNIVDVISFHCTGCLNVWEGRKNIAIPSDNSSKNENISTVDREIMVSDYISTQIYKGVKDTKPIVDFNLNFTTKINPIEAKFEIVNVNSTMRFRTMALYLSQVLPVWSNKYICEEDKNEGNASKNIRDKELNYGKEDWFAEKKKIPNMQKIKTTDNSNVNTFLQSIEKPLAQNSLSILDNPDLETNLENFL